MAVSNIAFFFPWMHILASEFFVTIVLGLYLGQGGV
jgi:hypothetical protein